MLLRCGVAAATLSVVALAAPAAVSAAPSARVVDCDVWASYPNIKISSARGMTCRAAKRDMRRYQGQISRTFTTPAGFRCGRVSGVAVGGQWRCVKGARAYRFDFGD